MIHWAQSRPLHMFYMAYHYIMRHIMVCKKKNMVRKRFKKNCTMDYMFILFMRGTSWLWSYGSRIYNYLYNKCLSPLKLWVRIPLDTTLYDKVCQSLAPVSSTNKTDLHDITEILLKVALNTITLALNIIYEVLVFSTFRHLVVDYWSNICFRTIWNRL
jgi:hypothetical protein